MLQINPINESKNIKRVSLLYLNLLLLHLKVISWHFFAFQSFVFLKCGCIHRKWLEETAQFMNTRTITTSSNWNIQFAFGFVQKLWFFDQFIVIFAVLLNRVSKHLSRNPPSPLKYVIFGQHPFSFLELMPFLYSTKLCSKNACAIKTFANCCIIFCARFCNAILDAFFY